MGIALDRARAVRLMIFDVDGVLTDGRIYYTDSGQEMKAFSTLDGHGMRMLMASGLRVAILTGRRSDVVAHRARNLGIDIVMQGVQDKRSAFLELAASLDYADSQCGYMGDDVVDLPVLTRCGFAASTHEAPEIVRRNAHFVATQPAGAGAAREVCETIMRAQGTLDAVLAPYLK
jgi:3-deoxy-D-manno-octulosonate 8-phosphate phosphatase (KDO 8-P phosphatase)